MSPEMMSPPFNSHPPTTGAGISRRIRSSTPAGRPGGFGIRETVRKTYVSIAIR
jgi:hypothetical protein